MQLVVKRSLLDRSKELSKISYMKAKITSKGQITLPKALRDKMGLTAGDILEFDESVPYLKAFPAFDAERMRSVIGRGSGKLKKSSRKLIDDMRGPVELP